MGRLLGQVKDLLSGVWRGNGVLTLSRHHRVVLLTIIIGVEEFFEPLNEIQVVLKPTLDELLYWNYLQVREFQSIPFHTLSLITRPRLTLTLSTFILLKEA